METIKKDYPIVAVQNNRVTFNIPIS